MTRLPDVLAARHRPTLARFAASNVLLAFDYDGTLAPIVPVPSHADMRPGTRRLLAQVARRYPTIVISGRALDDVTERLSGIPLWYVFGTFGHEPEHPQTRPPVHVSRWARTLTERLQHQKGLVIEEKRHSVTIHYRHAPDARRARKAIARAVGELTDARVLGSPRAVTLLHHRGPNKGVALQRARREFRCDTALYVGDDETDEDAFGSDPPERLLAIRVGSVRGSKASYQIPGQAQIDELLRVLVALRPAPVRGPA
jgi:trehalose 6-phosphate phosphatase